MGLGHLANAIVQVEVGRSFSHLAAWAMNCMGPQDATMLTLIEHGTEQQKQKYLVPQAKGEKIATYGLTEPGAGSDVIGARSTARREGNEWVLWRWRDFYYDTNSPYAYLAANRVDDVLPVTPEWRPISFGVIVRDTGKVPWSFSEDRDANFADIARRARWARPVITAEVEYLERTPSGRLRHPVWRGLRPG